jgi:hypothetical protein
MRIPFLLASIFVFFGNIELARADWLDDAWSGKSTALHGNPAITVRPGGVTVVLPVETLDEAFSERGMTRADALRAFLDRYSPQCSNVLDLNVAQPNLTVELRIQAAMPLGDIPAQSLDEMSTAMETVKIPPSKDLGPKAAGSKGPARVGHAQIPRIAQAFMTLPERYTFTIDYAPDKIVHCVVPQDPSS